MIRVRPMQDDDRSWVIRRLKNAFGDATVARKGASIDASVLPGFVAAEGGRPVGFLTYEAAHGEFEVVAIISVEEGRGIGQALMDAARDHAVTAGCRRLWLVTTNDNTRALRFYRHGARRSRRAKPSLPERGADGIPLEHELEFELLLARG
jgi:ribosomal protein S18 acetylase RimI-like enzyme